MDDITAPKIFLGEFDNFKNISRLDVFRILLEKSDLARNISQGAYVAIKIHFGELGNLAFIKPQYVRVLVEFLKELGAKPFVTDTNCLNGTWRLNAIDHYNTAVKNGFSSEIIGAPIIIADGLLGNNCKWVSYKNMSIEDFAIGKALYDADFIVYLSHVKGHQIGGFAGALKNLGVGSAAKIGKMDIHYRMSPTIAPHCSGCNACIEACNFGAITCNDSRYKINSQLCTGCCSCMEACKNNNIEIYQLCNWKEVQTRYVEYAAAMSDLKPNGLYFVNFMENISRICDCWGFSNDFFIKDIGIASGQDPVALDHLCFDEINTAGRLQCTDIKNQMSLFLNNCIRILTRFIS